MRPMTIQRRARRYRRVSDRALRAAIDEATYRVLLRRYRSRLLADLERLLRSDLLNDLKG